jgi:hypothetical protein
MYYLSRTFFCGALGKHHSQNHEAQNTNTQTASAQDVFADVVVVLAIINGAMVCVVNATANAVSDVSNSFHGVYLSLCFSLL